MMERKEMSNQEYVCVLPREGERLYDYFNGVLTKEEVEAFEKHLFLCFRCQETLLKLSWIFAMLREKQNDFFPPRKVNTVTKIAPMRHTL